MLFIEKAGFQPKTSMKRYQYGFIGMGNMGYAILNGLLKECDPEKIIFYERSEARALEVTEKMNVTAAKDAAACAADCQYLVLAVKPQQYDAAINSIRSCMTSEQIIISIAPGITIADLTERFQKPCRIVRAMPNTPALVGEGMTGVSYDTEQFSEAERQTIRTFFESFGRMELIEEKLMDAVVCASGSSPAYIYMVIEALADSAVKYGLPRATAYKMVAQTVLGSAKMVLETGEHPGHLKDQVCSPAGTTIAGVAALEEFGLRNSFIKASDACYEVCNRLKK